MDRSTVRLWLDVVSSLVETCGVQAYGAQIGYTSLLTIRIAQAR